MTDRQFYKRMGICPDCRKVKLWGSENNCPECKAKDYERKMREPKEHKNKIHREWSKRKHKECLDLGLCTRCRKRKPDNGFKTCGICRAKIRTYKRDKKGEPINREENGICRFCDKKVEIGYKVCEYHHKMNIEKANLQKTKEARNKLIKQGILY